MFQIFFLSSNIVYACEFSNVQWGRGSVHRNVEFLNHKVVKSTLYRRRRRRRWWRWCAFFRRLRWWWREDPAWFAVTIGNLPALFRQLVSGSVSDHPRRVWQRWMWNEESSITGEFLLSTTRPTGSSRRLPMVVVVRITYLGPQSSS